MYRHLSAGGDCDRDCFGPAGATALDKRSAKAYKAAMLAKLGAAADKRPRIPTKMKLGMAKKAKQREAVALEEAIAAGMVKAKGRGKKARAIKGKHPIPLSSQVLKHGGLGYNFQRGG
jgi:hypothetical protein